MPEALTQPSAQPTASSQPAPPAQFAEQAVQQQAVQQQAMQQQAMQQQQAVSGVLRKERDRYKEMFEAAVADRRLFEAESLMLMEEWFLDRASRGGEVSTHY